jgi:predicted DNA-binding transcriptional regulator
MTTPTIAHQEAVVVRAVRESIDGLTREEIAREARLLLASVCARVNTLIREGILREHGTRKGRYGRAAAIVRVNP